MNECRGTPVIDFKAAGLPVISREEEIAVCSIELSLKDPEYPDLVAMLDYWISKCGNRFAPCRQDIDPLEIIPHLQRLMLADVLRNPMDFRYRLCGTEISIMHGVELTHRSVLDLKPASYGAMIRDHYVSCVTERRPMQHAIHFQNPDRSRTYVRLLLPLSADGEDVNMLMTLDSSVGDRRGLRELFHHLISLEKRI